jgi:hypothetical protein
MMNLEKGLTQSGRPFDYFQPAAANKSYVCLISEVAALSQFPPQRQNLPRAFIIPWTGTEFMRRIVVGR